jgi:hypothetical protein
MPESPPYIQLVISGSILYFRDSHPFWRLEKDIIEFILPKKTDARDIRKVIETVTLRGTWYDDYGQVGDGMKSVQRMNIVRTASKNVRKYHYLLWNNEPFKVWFRDLKFDKVSGEGDAVTYSIEMVVVDK